jgi:hypothetical protein
VLTVAEVKALRRGKRSTKKLKEEYSSRSRYENSLNEKLTFPV